VCRLVEDASQSSGLQAQAMDSLQEKLRQLQSTIDQERAASVQAKVLSVSVVYMFDERCGDILQLNKNIFHIGL